MLDSSETVVCATEPPQDSSAEVNGGDVEEAIQEEVDRLLQALEVYQ